MVTIFRRKNRSKQRIILFFRPEIESNVFLLPSLKVYLFFGSDSFIASSRNNLKTNANVIKFQRKSRERFWKDFSGRKPNFGTLLITSVTWWWERFMSQEKVIISGSFILDVCGHHLLHTLQTLICQYGDLRNTYFMFYKTVILNTIGIINSGPASQLNWFSTIFFFLSPS